MPTVIRTPIYLTGEGPAMLCVGKEDDAHEIRRILIGREGSSALPTISWTGSNVIVGAVGSATASSAAKPSWQAGMRYLARPTPATFLTTHGGLVHFNYQDDASGIRSSAINGGTATKSTNSDTSYLLGIF